MARARRWKTEFRGFHHSSAASAAMTRMIYVAAAAYPKHPQDGNPTHSAPINDLYPATDRPASGW